MSYVLKYFTYLNNDKKGPFETIHIKSQSFQLKVLKCQQKNNMILECQFVRKNVTNTVLA